MVRIQWQVNHLPPSKDQKLSVMACEEVDKAKRFHESFPQYEITPLVHLPHLAQHLGLGHIYVKDESYRFNLNAFKVLGGSYAIGRYIAQRLGKDISELPYYMLTSDKVRNTVGEITFYTATDGNHGRGIAWSAKVLGQKANVIMPKGTTIHRFNHIRQEGAEVSIEKLNYDDCVRLAAKKAEEDEQGVIVQDTAWEGYEKIPTWIMQGYGTMAAEVADEFDRQGIVPTHIVVQAGVGSLAGAIVGYFTNRYQGAKQKPKMIIVEAEAANCLYRSAAIGDGNPHTVEGDLATIMAGLACGEPNTIAWDILRNHADVFVSVPDEVAELGMRISAAPLKGDPSITSGESGAAPLGLVASLMKQMEYKNAKEMLGLNSRSIVLCFSTEGDTDPARYKDIIWRGKSNLLAPEVETVEPEKVNKKNK